jgi:hypothetical protein
MRFPSGNGHGNLSIVQAVAGGVRNPLVRNEGNLFLRVEVEFHSECSFV